MSMTRRLAGAAGAGAGLCPGFGLGSGRTLGTGSVSGAGVTATGVPQ